MRFALTLAALLAASAPAVALGEADSWQRYQQIQQPPIGTAGGAGITFPTLQPTWITPPASRLEPPQRLQTTCYLLGNILTCY
jgi:hypothetical protein